MFFQIEGPALPKRAIRMLDERAIGEYQIPGVVLMENAGLWAAFTAMEMIKWDSQKKVVIFCGKGNNGGDGFVVARHLYNRRFPVEICLLGEASSVKEGTDAFINLKIVQKMGIPLREIKADQNWGALFDDYADFGLVVDALLGTGASGAITSPYEELIGVINAFPFSRLAIDIPSGLEADTGKTLGCCVRADATVTFGAKKLGFDREDGPQYTGEVVLVEISWPRQIVPQV